MILEKKCSKDLANFFRRLEKDIHKIINEYWDNELGLFHLNKISDLITLRKQEYYDILFKYCKIQYDRSRRRTERLFNQQLEQMSIKSDINITTLSSLFKPDPAIKYNLNNKIFVASEHTLNRVDKLVMTNLSESYEQGLGIEEAKNRLTVKYNGLKGWEAQRIARTEINSAQNDACFDMYDELGCEYHQWWTAQDERVRNGSKGTADHTILHGKIVRVGTKFSNGLMYPGDRTGSIKEWINCRCTTIPYLIPLGKMVPMGMTEFTEDDLIDIPNWNTPSLDDVLSGDYSTGIQEFKVNLAKPPIESSIISEENHRKTIDEIENILKSEHSADDEINWYKNNFERTFETDKQWQEKFQYLNKIEQKNRYRVQYFKEGIVSKNYNSKIDDIENVLKRGNSKDDELRWYRENFRDKQNIDQWRDKYDYLVDIEKRYPTDTRRIRKEVSETIKDFDIERLRSVDDRRLFRELEIKARNNTLTPAEEKKYKSLLKYVKDKNLDVRFVDDYNIKKGSTLQEKTGENSTFTHLGGEAEGNVERYRVYNLKDSNCEIWVSEDTTINTENLFKLIDEVPKYIRDEADRVIFSQTKTTAYGKYIPHSKEIHMNIGEFDVVDKVPDTISYAYVHEYGHRLDSMLGKFTYDKKLYRSLFKGDPRFISSYGDSSFDKLGNYSEDFADTFSYVKRNPKKYGKEYKKRVKFVNELLEREIKTPEEFEKFVVEWLS